MPKRSKSGFHKIFANSEHICSKMLENWSRLDGILILIDSRKKGKIKIAAPERIKTLLNHRVKRHALKICYDIPPGDTAANYEKHAKQPS